VAIWVGFCSTNKGRFTKNPTCLAPLDFSDKGKFYRWLKRDYGDWFGKGELPERTRFQRLLKPTLAGGARAAHRSWCEMLMAKPTFFTVIDTYPIELIFLIRAGRTKQQIGKKNKDKGAGA